MTNQNLLNNQSPWLAVMHQTIQAESIKGYDGYGKAILDPTTVRTYRCYVTETHRMDWSVEGTTESLPYTAYILTVPITGPVQNDVVPILETDVLQVLTPVVIPIRRFGLVNTYTDQFGNRHNIEIRFQ
jgi:hypothetical protein